MREAHEVAVRKSMAAFDATAVGAGATRQKHEMRLQQFLKKAFEVFFLRALFELVDTL